MVTIELTDEEHKYLDDLMGNFSQVTLAEHMQDFPKRNNDDLHDRIYYKLAAGFPREEEE